MRDEETERVIVHSFVVKEKRKRALLVLSSEQKRKEFFVYWYRYLDRSHAIYLKKGIERSDDVYKILKEMGAPDICYMMGTDIDKDCSFLPLNVALKRTVFNGYRFVSCIHGQLGFFEEDKDDRMIFSKM